MNYTLNGFKVNDEHVQNVRDLDSRP